MNGLSDFNSVITYIEQNLDKNINIETLAGLAKMSVYEFRRIFSFVTGVPVSEYVRKRRLSAAAEDLLAGSSTVTEAALKYGYDAPSSFSRAFKEFHGFTPAEIHKPGNDVNTFTKITFEFGVSGGSSISYSILHDSGFYVCGISGISGADDTECCENVWNSFYSSPHHSTIEALCSDKIYAVYENEHDSVRCHIGARSDSSLTFPGCVYVKSAAWACFRFRGADDAAVNNFYGKLIFDWLKSTKYKKLETLPNIEVFPTDMSDDNFPWEIRIPIEY